MKKLSFNDYNRESLETRIRDKIMYSWKNGLTDNEIQKWLDNFIGKVFDNEVEQTLALILLDNFIYINHDEVMQLCRDLYLNLIHDLMLTGKKYDDIIKSIRFLPIGNPSESSSLVMYFFRLANDIPKDQFIYYTADLNEDDFTVFIDDFAGTGDQAINKNIIPLLNKNIIKSSKAFYLCLVGTETAIKLGDDNGIKVIPSVILDSRSKVFDKNSYTKFDDELSEMLKKFIIEYEKEVNWYPYGFGDSELAFGFYYNVPDNCLPVFWADNKKWNPIFKRFHKKYVSNFGGQTYEFRYPFI